MSRSPAKILKDIHCVVYDFDGVMTDNKVTVYSDGTEAVVCHRGDGLAVSRFRKAGLLQCIISTEKNRVVARRAKKLRIRCIQGCNDKARALKEYIRSNHLDLVRTAYIGNDLNDLDAMRLAGFRAAPSDSAREILDIADIVLQARGGQGVVYEFFKRWNHAVGGSER